MIKIVIVGMSGGTHLGDAFKKAAIGLGISDASLSISKDAYDGPRFLQRMSWRFLAKRPLHLNKFSQTLLDLCNKIKPKYLLASGIAPINRRVLQELRIQGVKCINFLTDDPFNPAHKASFFLKALEEYDFIFTPRQANQLELHHLTGKTVEYLPFGYDPELFYPDLPKSENQHVYSSEVVFAGGGDLDRVPYISALLQSGIKVGLYGGFWDRYPETKFAARGLADLQTLRYALTTSKISLCLVRRANRDGHVMRTFEVPAVGTCMLTEDTADHRRIFGDEGQAVLYFKTATEMVEKARWLLKHDAERLRMAQTAHLLITQGKNTYADRLQAMLEAASCLLR
jgi:glycosyltransferase involved in cell wall biosynthesis